MSVATVFTIGELAQVADVTTRTIRYYVEQGLIPPPRGGGRAASYGEEHLRRLELIKLLKEEFLPLNEIKALLAGLDDDAVRDLLTGKRQPSPPPAPETAKEYLRALLNPPEKSTPLLRQAVEKRAAAKPVSSPAKPRAIKMRSTSAVQGSRISKESEPSQEVVTNWQHYRLHPDIELHVRQPPSDATFNTRLDRLIADIRRLIKRHNL
jgi:DNA-binding transcriptional MerR regulator